MYNAGVWAYHTFKPKMAEAYLQKALTLYREVYGEKHLKVGLCLTELGMVGWDFSTSLDDDLCFLKKNCGGSNTFWKCCNELMSAFVNPKMSFRILSLLIVFF